MATMRVAAKPEAAPMKAAQSDIPTPGIGEVRIKVQACGVCHSDVLTKERLWPGIQYPRVPGHEVAGIIDEVSSGVTGWKRGQRVGVGWHGGQDNTCRECRRGDFRNCRNLKIPGISYDGGYQQYMVAPIEALALIPDMPLEWLVARHLIFLASPVLRVGQSLRAVCERREARTHSLLGLNPYR